MARVKTNEKNNVKEFFLNLLAYAIVGCVTGAFSVMLSVKLIANDLINLKESVVQNKTDIDKRVDKVEDIALDAFKLIHSLKAGG